METTTTIKKGESLYKSFQKKEHLCQFFWGKKLSEVTSKVFTFEKIDVIDYINANISNPTLGNTKVELCRVRLTTYICDKPRFVFEKRVAQSTNKFMQKVIAFGSFSRDTEIKVVALFNSSMENDWKEVSFTAFLKGLKKSKKGLYKYPTVGKGRYYLPRISVAGKATKMEKR